MAIITRAAQIFRDFVTNGVPSSGRHEPSKSEIRAWGAVLESNLAASFDSLADLTATRVPPLNFIRIAGYYAPGDGGGSTYIRLDTAPVPLRPWHRQSGDGAWWELRVTEADIRMFGARGDYTTDDTAAKNAWLLWSETKGLPLFISAGAYRITDSIVLPKGVKMRGVGSCQIATFPQYDFANKDRLRPGYKGTISGSNFIFSGGPSITIETGRADFPTLSPMIAYDFMSPCQVRGVGFIQDMDVRNASGALTTGSTDNRASAYTVGLFNRSTLSIFSDVTVFGYFNIRGLVHMNVPGDDGGTGNDPDYTKFSDCFLSGGVAVWGADINPQPEGNTGTQFIGSSLFGCDHHTRVDSNPNIPVLHLDGYLSTIQQMRGHNFSACSFRGVANVAIKLDHCNDIYLNGTTEFSEVAGVAGLESRGEIVGTPNTQNITLVGLAATGHLGLEALKTAISGNLNVLGTAGSSLGSFVNLHHERLVKSTTLAVSSGVLSPTGRSHNVSSTGDPVITSFDVLGLKEGEVFQLERSGTGSITIQSGNNIALWKGWKNIVLDAASDYAVFERRGSNAFLRAFANIGGGSDNREIPQLIKRTFTFDLPALSSGSAGATQVLTFAEAEFGDAITVGCSISPQGLTVTAYVNAVGSVTLRTINLTGASVDLASATFTIFLFKS